MACPTKRYRFHTQNPLRNIIFGKLFAVLFKGLNQLVPWHRLGWRLGLLNLIVLRNELRAKNLIDTEDRKKPPQTSSSPKPVPKSALTSRTFDGRYNDLTDPMMGAVGSTFGRNMAPNYQPQLFGCPDPIIVSRELLSRKEFIKAPSLNLLAAAWIQFQVHDWVNHSRHNLGKHDIVLPMPNGEQWSSHEQKRAEDVMRIAGNKLSPKGQEGYPIFENLATSWWDASEVYGATKADADKVREGARIRLDGNSLLPVDQNGAVITGFNESWWLGLGIFHTLFAREHNAVCDELEKKYRGWNDEQVYQTARLIVTALIAKIHTVEWTPAILATETIDAAMQATWHGAPKDWISQLFIWLLDTRALEGIPGGPTEHHNVPYSLTEEFVSVYRMHPLIPDYYYFFDYRTGRPLPLENSSGERKLVLSFNEIQGVNANVKLQQITLPNAIYSFGIACPGAIKLHNFPNSLTSFKRENGEIIDLSVVDIVRDRRRGVPRYNDFREAVHKPRIRHWKEISDDPEVVRQLRGIYSDIDQVDTMVGLYAEPPPEGFGFSDTAFRIFILMATRRLQSDRFFTVDYRPDVYSPLGMDWIEQNTMTSVILRHCPALGAVLSRSENAFAPW